MAETSAARRRMATVGLALACAAWGISFPFLKDVDTGLARALREAPAWLAPCWLVAARFLLAGALLWPFVRRAITRDVWRDALLLALPSAPGYLLQTGGMRGVDAGTNAFLTSLYTPLTPLLAWLLLRRAPAPRVLVAVPVALAGVALLSRAEAAGAPAPGGPSKALYEGLVLLATLCWALQILGIDRWARRHPAGAFSAALFVWIGLGGLLAALGVAAWGRVAPDLLLAPLGRPRIVVGLAGLVLVSTILAMVLITRFQPDLDPSRAAILYTLEPAFAAVFALLLQGERFAGGKLAGCLVLLAANVVVEVPLRPRARGGPGAPPGGRLESAA
jgi:drug/metabolite transporter (DMT)-like permease